TLLTAVFDESAFWRSDESASPDTEVYRAILPSLSKNALEAQLRLPHLLLRWLAVASKLTRFTHTSRFTHTLCFPKIPSGPEHRRVLHDLALHGRELVAAA